MPASSRIEGAIGERDEYRLATSGQHTVVVIHCPRPGDHRSGSSVSAGTVMNPMAQSAIPSLIFPLS